MYIVTSCLGCTDIIESQHHDAHVVSCTFLLYFHYCKRYNGSHLWIFRGFNNWLVITRLPVMLSSAFWEIQAIKTSIAPKNTILLDYWDQLLII